MHGKYHRIVNVFPISMTIFMNYVNCVTIEDIQNRHTILSNFLMCELNYRQRKRKFSLFTILMNEEIRFNFINKIDIKKLIH